MARAELMGLCVCPECNFNDAEVRPDKSGAPYRFCPDCTAQYFTRGVPHKVKNLLLRLRKYTEIKIVTPVVQSTIVPANKNFSLQDL